MLTIMYDPKNARIVGEVPLEVTEYLYNALAYQLEGIDAAKAIFYASRGKKNKIFAFWDGINRLYQKGSKTFPTGLIWKVSQYLTSKGIQHNFKRINPSEDFNERFKPVHTPFVQTLREDQLQVIDSLLKYHRAAAQAPTGSGKSVVASELCMRFPKLKIMVTVPNLYLLHQTQQEIARFTKEEVGIWGDSEYEDGRIVVATIQTAVYGMPDLKNLKKSKKTLEEVVVTDEQKARRERLAEFDMIIYDEAHLVASDSHRILSDFAVNAWIRYGLSATLHREDGAEELLEGIIGPKVCQIDISPLMEKGILSEVRVHMFEYTHPEEEIKLNWKETQENVLQNISRTRFGISLAQKMMDEYGLTKILMLFVLENHGKQILAETLPICPEAVLIDGKDTMKKRGSAVQKLENSETKILLSSKILDVGANIPCVQGLIPLAAGKSTNVLGQRVGRILRPHAEKTISYVFDIYDKGNVYLENQAKQRLAAYCRFYGAHRVCIVKENGIVEQMGFE